jgi:D-glycero-alpha-D-manno-heptose 1-phosphate guanylyltransferase
MEAVVLAGGMGTRLQSVVRDVPKCMAPVAGKPFLHYLLTALETAGFRHVVLSLGYKHEVIEDWIAGYRTSLKISFVVEKEPLGTGGAVKWALTKATQPFVFVLNGDTFLSLDYRRMLAFHTGQAAVYPPVAATLALKEMCDFDRYGVVETGADGRIIRFREKQACERGYINGGVYLIARDALAGFHDKFSLEKEFFETIVDSGRLAAFPTQGYFIDIGIPKDYNRAQIDFEDGKQNAL